jgi:hypothetical protein
VVIAGIEGAISHWSIITAVTQHYVMFYDSDKNHRLALRNCTLGRSHGRSQSQYRISLHGVVRLERLRSAKPIKEDSAKAPKVGGVVNDVLSSRVFRCT